MKAQKQRSTKFILTVPREMLTLWRERADAHGLSLAGMIRQAVTVWIESQEELPRVVASARLRRMYEQLPEREMAENSTPR